ncbi:MAG: hypothetical protein JOZ54_11490 [Acidobacteria bacterium]|nr:hypothetical protein [Acidobacteriota bacterium]
MEHILRAAGAITGRKEWVIVGSQAILGAVPNAPAEITVSEELDLYAPGDERASDLIDGSIGERSPFHETFGYYAHGVGAETAMLPKRWRARAVQIHSEATQGVVGICPDPSDLAISKLAAWREKDCEFIDALLRHRIVTADEIEARFPELDESLVMQIRPRLRAAVVQAR